jgi:hypothetical protein
MEKKQKYNNFGTVLKFIRKIVERGEMDTTQIYDLSVSRLCTGS